ncbi:MAG: squalene--hopene cyclase [Chthonomonadales bacterium]|nr:squalene--hopene cyclase [Chthonomonadales bacterium]
MTATESMVPTSRADPPGATGAPSGEGEDYACDLDQAILRAQRWLLASQQPDGHWVGELEGDTILESEYALLLQFLGRDDPRMLSDLTRYAVQRWQRDDGGVPIYPGGPSDVSASVKLYFACKLAGHSGAEPFMQRLRECILRLGGVTQCNTFTKLYLAIFGQYSWDGVPTIPPELMLAPRWFYVNVYAMSSWSRAILIPLAIINAMRPSRPVPESCSIDELFVGDRSPASQRLRRDRRLLSWRNVFLLIDRLLKYHERSPIKPFRAMALRRAQRWLIEHLQDSDGLAAVFPAMTHAVMALTCLGYPQDSPEVSHEMDELARFIIRDERGVRLQPCVSPVWDTAIAVNAMVDSSPPSAISGEAAGAMRAAVEWLIAHEVRSRGDWSLTVGRVEPGGWAFEYRNPFYPDTDDTAMVVMALIRASRHFGRSESVQHAMDRAVRWVLAMQSRNGGWGSFDRDNTRVLMQYVPYADHNAMLDPPTADVSARVIEALAEVGLPSSHPAVQRATRFVLAEQEPDGSWFGRWGVNYLYGTWQAIQGLTRSGLAADHHAIERASQWLLSVQNADGGWGESCASYADPSLRGVGESTPSQTAWALMGLVSAGMARTEACRRGVRYLIEHQTPDGTWEEDAFTGTGFPCVFYLRYHLYRHSFPLWALGKYRAAISG